MIIIFYDNFASFKKSKLTYKLILSKQKAGFDIESCFLVSAEIYLHRFIRSGLLTFFSSLVIQESLINFAGERLRNRMTSHCEIILSFCLSAILWSWTRAHRTDVHFPKRTQNVSRSFRRFGPVFQSWAFALVSWFLVSNHLLCNFQPCQVWWVVCWPVVHFFE